MTAGAPDRSRQAMTSLLALAPVGLVVVAEAAWISILGGLLQEFSLHDPLIGIPGLAVVVAAGAVIAHLVGPRLGRRWPVVALGLVAGAGAAGWLISGEARAALSAGIGPAIAAHPGGWLAGLALLRGFAHARLPPEEGTVARLLEIGVPGVAALALLGGAIADPYRTRFLGDALAAAIVFIGSTVLALAVVRLETIGVEGAFDWRRNPTWLGLTVLLVIGAIVAAIPLSFVAGTVISLVIGLAFGPILIVGLVTGFDRIARRVLLIVLIDVGIIYAAVLLFGRRSTPDTTTATGVAGTEPPSTAEQLMAMSIGGLILLLAVVGILVLVAAWLRRRRPPEDDLVAETRTIDRGGPTARSPRRHSRFGRRPEPTGAVEAYVALMDDLAKHADVRRVTAETPAEHAARLRTDGRAEMSLDLLAADYALARFGGVTLPAREDARAVGRWRLLRRRLVIHRGTRPSAPPMARTGDET